jgi:Yip1 domain
MDQLSPSAPPAATPPRMESSLLSRLLNVFVSPGEVFDEVKAGPPKASNWIVPLVLAILVGTVGAYIMFSQPRVLQSVKDQMEIQFEKQIKAGIMKRQDADRAEEIALKVMKYGAPVGAIFGNVIALFLTAAVFFLVGRFAFKGPVDFMPALEVTGLCHMVALLGAIIMVLLVVIYGGLGMTPGPILLVDHFDPQNRVHIILSNLNIMNLWYIAVLGLGLSRLSGASWLKSTTWTFCLWALLVMGPALAMTFLKPRG